MKYFVCYGEDDSCLPVVLKKEGYDSFKEASRARDYFIRAKPGRLYSKSSIASEGRLMKGEGK